MPQTNATILPTPFMQRHLPYAVGAVGRIVQRTPTAVLVEFDRDYEDAHRVRGCLRARADGGVEHVGGHVRVPLRRWRIVLDLADVAIASAANVDGLSRPSSAAAQQTACNAVTTAQAQAQPVVAPLHGASAQQTACNAVTTAQAQAQPVVAPLHGASAPQTSAGPDYEALPPLYRNRDILPVLMVAAVFHVTEQTINNWLRKPGCKAVRAIGCRRGASIAALAAWLASTKTAPAA